MKKVFGSTGLATAITLWVSWRPLSDQPKGVKDTIRWVDWCRMFLEHSTPRASVIASSAPISIADSIPEHRLHLPHHFEGV